MSYILEALKKSDRERNRGTTPGLQTIQAMPAPAPRKRHWWIYLLVFALLLNAGLILYWLQPWTATKSDLRAAPEQTAPDSRKLVIAENNASDKLDTPVTPSAKSESLPQGAKETAGRAHPPKADLSRKDPSPTAKKVVAKSTQNQTVKKATASSAAAKQAIEKKQIPVEDYEKTSDTPPSVPEPAPNPAAAKKVEHPVAAQKAKPPPPAKPENDKGSEELKAVDSLSVEKLAELNSKVLDRALMTRQAPAERESPPPKPVPEKPKVPGLKSLPIEIQKEIPDLKLSFLVFSDKPQDRMVSINGQMKREGQEVAPGLKLEEITPEGAVFSYKSHRFQKGIF